MKTNLAPQKAKLFTKLKFSIQDYFKISISKLDKRFFHNLRLLQKSYEK